STAGEPGSRRRSPAVVGASAASTVATKRGSASMLPVPLLKALPLLLPPSPPCTRLWSMLGLALELKICVPVLAWLPQRITFVSAGLLPPRMLPSLYIAPPAVAAELPLKVTLVSTGLLAPRRLPSLYIAPPALA